ncbi:MAG: hypothetical protein Q9P01_03710 [Anaerolineae bacterium]|nr:hypothetical protein [Anaerolineae bacterium]
MVNHAVMSIAREQAKFGFGRLSPSAKETKEVIDWYLANRQQLAATHS